MAGGVEHARLSPRPIRKVLVFGMSEPPVSSRGPLSLLDTLQKIVVPLIEVDAGEVYLVRMKDNEVALHLAGTCSGCPGITLTTRGVIEPALKAINSQVRVTITSGVLIPKDAQRLYAHGKVPDNGTSDEDEDDIEVDEDESPETENSAPSSPMRDSEPKTEKRATVKS
jgi:Fe-S cluster biogenesis protein NfuA